MKDARLAEAYCDRMYEAAAKEKGQQSSAKMPAWSGLAAQPNYDMYLSLIQVAFRFSISGCSSKPRLICIGVMLMKACMC